jgi:four helix bundle protein
MNGGMSSNYVPLKVLGLGKTLSESIYMATNDRRFQREVTLKNQLRRAALSVPSNIAEGDAGVTLKRAYAFSR